MAPIGMPDTMAPPGGAPAPPMDPGAAAPGAAPQAPPALGLQAAASQKVVESRKALEAALLVFGAETEEGKALLKAVEALGSIFPGEAMAAGGGAKPPAAPAGAPMGGPKPGAQFGM